MTDEKFLKIKESYVSNIKRFITETGNIFPHITVFGKHKEDDLEEAIIHIPVPDEFLKSEQSKDEFIDEVVPKIAEKIKEKFIPEGVAWTSEAWIRQIGKEEKLPENWKELPIKKEVVFITMEFATRKDFMVYEIKRLGKQVNQEGELVDQVDLIEEDFSSAEQATGRLSNLYSKFISNH